MKSVETFMREFLDEQIALMEQEEALRVPFVRRFYTDDCLWGKSPGKLERARSQKVLSISSTDTRAEVITSRLADVQPQIFAEIRYRLENRDQRWIICGVDLRCCCGDGESAEAGCPGCHGTGWKDTNLALAPLSSHDVSRDNIKDAEQNGCTEPQR